MKLLSIVLSLAFLLLCSGCFPLTEMVKERTEGHTSVNKRTHEVETVPGNSAYYALAPLAIPADIAMMPIFGVGFAAWWAAGFPGFTGH